MIPRIPNDPLQRAERKANLLLASELLRGQVQRDVTDLGDRADVVVNRVMVVRGWLSDPTVLAAAGGAAAFFAAGGQKRRSKLLGALRWAWLAWRIWRRR